MKHRFVFLILLFFAFVFAPFAQTVPATLRPFEYGDAEAARQYAEWARQIQREGRMEETLAVLERAADFANVSSDISYQLAWIRYYFGKSRASVIAALNNAIDVSRWENYNKNQALLLKADQLIIMRRYTEALAALDQAAAANDNPANMAVMRLMAFKGLAASGDTQAQAQFRTLLLQAMDQYSRDPRFVKIFFEYAGSRNPKPSDLPASDLNLLEIALRQLPFLIEADPELAWMAAPFIRDVEEARRYTSSYRAGAIPNVQNRDFMPHPGSIAVALNLGLIDDTQAADELFSRPRRSNPQGAMAIDRKNITDVYNLLRSEEGRDYFTQKLLSFSGLIISDDENDGYFESQVYYASGVIKTFSYDKNQEGIFGFSVEFSVDGSPASAEISVTGETSFALVLWERYPSAKEVAFQDETFLFRPVDFQFAPVSFTTLGGSRRYAGLSYPILTNNINLTRRSLVLLCSSISRPSTELRGATEEIFFNRGGIPRQAVETFNGKQASVTEFERGLPVLQQIDLDLDGRMETIRRFRSPQPNFSWAEGGYEFNYRLFVASSESDWAGDGRYKTGEVYLQDGSVVYTFDMDGSGTMNYSETDTGNR